MIDTGSGKSFHKHIDADKVEKIVASISHDPTEEKRIKRNLEEDLGDEKRNIISKRLKIPPLVSSNKTMADYRGSDFEREDFGREDFGGHTILFDKTSNGMKSKPED